ncbi:tyrosine-type recombinase/integrase [Pseudomonas sp. R37(2017)]|uniref:tyrosine-type recombinase/integrase n=1 Tax=Pseudomonas sp. R37(2017) TaxID=1981685 RepID=UPI000A1F16FA|nr:tyrosine-type recombinase/integrase [Pseudomonas sp. R37(2017)]
MADHIFQKKNESTWYVRLDVPKDVRRALGNRTVLIQSLKTGMRSEAMLRRLPILSQWKADIEAARTAKGNKGDEWRLAQHELGKQLKQKQNDGVSLLLTPINLDVVPDRPDGLFIGKLLEMAKAMEEMGEHALAARVTDHVKKFNDACEKGMTAGDAVVLHHNLLSIQGDAEAVVAAYEYNLSDEEHQEAQAIVRNPTLYKPRSPISPSMIEAWVKYLVTQIESEKTRDSHKARVEKISKFLTTEGAPLTFDTIHNFVKKQGGARQTLLNYLWSGRDFWKWAIKYNAQFRDEFTGQQCPFDGHDLPKVGKEAGESYLPFTRKEIEDLYKTAREGGKDDLANLIIFGAYTGARIEEIGRIEPVDTIFDQHNEPIGFHIPKAKSVAGVRDIPLHASLVPLYKSLCSQAPANDGYLFKGGNNKYGIRLDRLGKQFGRLKTKAEFSKLHVFHSIRKTTTTELHRAGVGLEVLPYIVGHENKSFTLSVYSGGCSFEQKQEAIQLLHFDFQK